MNRMITCEWCDAAVDISDHFGRPPRYCSATCRRAGRILADRRRRADRKAELQRLRTRLDRVEAALAA